MEDDEDVSFHEGFDLLNEGGDSFGVFVESVDAAEVPQQLDKLVFLDIVVFFLFSDLF